jgi:hypothetical protein
MSFDPESKNTPVFFCQGEVFVEEVAPGSNTYVLLEPLLSCGLEIGDTMPQEWSTIPANKAARDLMAAEGY